MKLTDVFRMCIRNLLKRKTRTCLTVLGVIIGTCAIIVMVSLGVGMNEAMDNMIDDWADLTLITVNPDTTPRPEGEEPAELNDDAVEAFKEIAHVQAVSPFLSNVLSMYPLYGNITVYNDDYAASYGNIVGVNLEDFERFGYQLSDGRWAEDGDGMMTALVGVRFGEDAYDYNFEEWAWAPQDDEGKYISVMDFMNTEIRAEPPIWIEDEEYGGTKVDTTSIGDQNAPNAQYDNKLNIVGQLGTYDDWAVAYNMYVSIDFIDYYIKAFNEINPDYKIDELDGTYSQVQVRVDDMNSVSDVETAIKEMGFYTWSNTQSRDMMKQQVQMIQMLLAALAGISLFVAALNITNTMITAVIERTREIGIMKVLGCDVSKILALFLGEAAAIGFIGGVMGIGLSFGISAIFNSFPDAIMGLMGTGDSGRMSFPEGIHISQIPPWLAIGGLLFATVIGVVAGFYPAFRGTRISALSAIAHE